MSTTEKWKYDKAYTLENYHLQGLRADVVKAEIEAMQPATHYLDVGCGRGESLQWARERGIYAVGTELVDAIIAENPLITFADVCELPFENDAFDYVSCYDVLEHLVPGDEQAALDELGRVCKGLLIITTNDRPSFLPTGEDLHVNKRPRAAWHQDIVDRFEPVNVRSTVFGPAGYEQWKWKINCEGFSPG